MQRAIAAIAAASRRTAPVALALALCGLLASAALGGPPNSKREAPLDSTVRFLQDSQQASGGFAQAGEPSQGTSAWVALALAAAGINPRNQGRPCGTDAYAYLLTHFRESTASEAQIATTAFERELLVVDAAGTDPHDFAGFDLANQVLERQLPNGAFPPVPGGEAQINTTVFAILALSPVAEPRAQAAIGEAAEWLLAQQKRDGGWHWQPQAMTSEVDMTAAAIEALSAAGPPGDPAAFASAQGKAFEYLEEAQLPDGGFPALPLNQRESNVASTAWAVQGMWSAGRDPETWRTGSGLATEEPLDYLESMQQSDGHIRWARSSDPNGIWMTAYVAPAFAGQALPIPAATFSSASLPPCEKGGDGEAGVIAGGGGEGAPLFSRPKPQSKGRTPGGARIVHGKGSHPRDHGGRRGANAKQPSGTENTEPGGTGARQEEATAVSPATGPGGGAGPGGHGNEGGGENAGTGSSSREGEPPLPAHDAARNAAAESGGHEVSGVVIGDAGSPQGGNTAFGAPGLHSAATGGAQELGVAAGIGVAALLAGLGGARLERRREGLLS